MNETKKRKVGRPPAADPRTHRHEVRLTDDEERMLDDLRAVYGSHCDIVSKALRLLHERTPKTARR